MRTPKKTKTADRLGLSLLAYICVMLLGIGYEVVAHGANVENRAAVVIYMTAMFAAWATAVFWPNEI